MLELSLSSPLDRVLFLRSHPFFQVNSRTLIAVAENSKETHFAAGATLIARGEETHSFFILAEGSVAMYYADEHLYDVRPPGAVGFIPVLAGRSLETSVVVLKETIALEIEIESLLQILEDHFGLVLSMTGALARSLAAGEEAAGIAPGTSSRPNVPMLPLDAELDLVDRLSCVRRIRLFAKANLGLLAELFRGDVVRLYDQGDFLCRAGEAPDAFEVLVDGLVRVEDTDGNRSGHIDAVGVVGWRDLFTGQPRVWSAIACGPVRTLHVPRELYNDVLEDNFEHTLAVVGQLARRYLDIYSLRSV
jgi:CRP-like cAMP-binding protein